MRSFSTISVTPVVGVQISALILQHFLSVRVSQKQKFPMIDIFLSLIKAMHYEIHLESKVPPILTNLIHVFRIYFQTKSVLPTPSLSSSTPYFTCVLWFLVAIKVYQFSWYLIPISIFIIIYKIMKYCLFYIYTYLTSEIIIQRVIYFFDMRRDVILPSPLHIIIRCIRKGDKKMNHSLQNSIDYLISAGMIVSLFILILFGTIFLLIQVEFNQKIQLILFIRNI
jgi:hypothetical protein